MLGNLDTVRDWGWAPEYASLAIAILDQERPDDFVVATGEGHSVRQALELTFGLMSLDWQEHLRVDESLVRPSEPAPLIGNSEQAAPRGGARSRAQARGRRAPAAGVRSGAPRHAGAVYRLLTSGFSRQAAHSPTASMASATTITRTPHMR